MTQDAPARPATSAASSAQRRPVGRPRTRILGRAVITAAARRIIATHGVRALTMTRLAQALGVTPSAVYNHARSKHEILRWIEDDVMGEVETRAFDVLPWHEALRVWAHSYRETLAKHPELITALATTEVLESPHTVRMYERVTRCLVEAGLPLPAVLPLITALEWLIHGTAVNEHAPENVYEVGELASIAPTFTGALRAWEPRGPGSNERDLFDMVFDAIVSATFARFAQVADPGSG